MNEYWRDLWEREGTGDRRAAWLEEIRWAIERLSRVPPPSLEGWDLEPAGAVKVIVKKKNWSAPGPDCLANFWWKHAHPLHEGVASAFQAISSSDKMYPTWLSEGKTSLIPSTVRNLSRSWNTRIVVTTKKGRKASETIMFSRSLPEGDALCPRLFTVCLNPIAWKIRASDRYRLSKPIDTKVTDLLYTDDPKIAVSESKLTCPIVSEGCYGECQVAMEP